MCSFIAVAAPSWCRIDFGDWRKKDKNEIYVPAGEHFEVTRSVTSATLAILSAIAGSQPTTYPRHRWTGQDIAIDEVGLLLSVCGIGRRHE